MNLSVEVCGITFPSPLINAAGAKDVSLADLDALGESAAGAIVIKTATVEFRRGNDTPRWSTDEFGSLNSMGLPNLGYERYIEYAPKLKEYGKPIIASLSGMKEGDSETMVKAYDASAVDMIEVNLSCPNLAGKGQLGYDFAASRDMLTRCRKLTKKPLGVKLPPYLDMYHFEAMAKVLEETRVDFIVTINSIGNALFIDPQREMKTIAPNSGFGGLGGKYVKPTALANVHKFYQLFGGSKPIIGVGGVSEGTDGFEHLLAGASAVGVGTQLVNEGPAVFSRLNDELGEVLSGHGYDSPHSAVGRLKELGAPEPFADLKQEVAKNRQTRV